MSGYFKEEQNVEKTEQLIAFNNQFEAYNRKLLRGTDVISVINKVTDNNKKYGPNEYDEPNYLMNVEFEMKEEIVYTEDGLSNSTSFEIGKRYNAESFRSIKNNKEAFTDFKRRIFDCVEIRYNNETGRVNYMRFTERKMTQNEYEGGL